MSDFLDLTERLLLALAQTDGPFLGGGFGAK